MGFVRSIRRTKMPSKRSVFGDFKEDSREREALKTYVELRHDPFPPSLYSPFPPMWIDRFRIRSQPRQLGSQDIVESVIEIE